MLPVGTSNLFELKTSNLFSKSAPDSLNLDLLSSMISEIRFIILSLFFVGLRILICSLKSSLVKLLNHSRNSLRVGSLPKSSRAIIKTCSKINSAVSSKTLANYDSLGQGPKRMRVGRKEGTATELLSELKEYVDDDELKRNRSWPRQPNFLSNRLNRIAPSLRKTGIDIEQKTVNGRKVWIFQLRSRQAKQADRGNQGVDGQKFGNLLN
jgi:hypothetical protein